MALSACIGLDAQVVIRSYPVEGIVYEPLPAVFALAPRGTVKESSIEIINKRPEALEIGEIQNPSARFAVRVEPLEAGRRFRFTVTLKGEGRGGKEMDVVELKTNFQNAPLLRIPVNTYVQENVYTFPGSVFLGNHALSAVKGKPAAAKGLEQILMVYRKGKPGFEIKITSDIPFLKIDSQLGPKGDQWENTIWLDADKVVAGSIEGTLFIETNDPQYPKLTVPITGKLLAE